MSGCGTHMTAADHLVVDAPGARVWRCSKCGATGEWKKGWTFFGRPECPRCSGTVIHRVHCPACMTRAAKALDTTYVWRVHTRLPERFGTRCRVLVRGRMNSCLVRFVADGYRVVTSRNYLRRAEA